MGALGLLEVLPLAALAWGEVEPQACVADLPRGAPEPALASQAPPVLTRTPPAGCPVAAEPELEHGLHARHALVREAFLRA